MLCIMAECMNISSYIVDCSFLFVCLTQWWRPHLSYWPGPDSAYLCMTDCVSLRINGHICYQNSEMVTLELDVYISGIKHQILQIFYYNKVQLLERPCDIETGLLFYCPILTSHVIDFLYLAIETNSLLRPLIFLSVPKVVWY